MKTFIITTLLMGYSLMSFTQDIPSREVPSVVLNAFETTYPDARDVEWEKEGDRFEVDFEVKNIDQVALIDNSGNLIMHKIDIRLEELPKAVTDAIQQNFKDRQIDDADRVEKGGITYYQVELEGTLFDKKVVYSSDGQLSEDFKYWD